MRAYILFSYTEDGEKLHGVFFVFAEVEKLASKIVGCDTPFWSKTRDDGIIIHTCNDYGNNKSVVINEVIVGVAYNA